MRRCHPPSLSRLARAGAVLVASAVGCATEEAADTGRGEAPSFTAAPPVLKRLTAAQYVNSVRDVFGPAVTVTEALEPDTEVNGLVAAGASVASLSAWGVEQYEAAARSIAAQALGDRLTRAALVPCAGLSVVDDTCATTALSRLGRRLWRRPLTAEEVARVVKVAHDASVDLGTFDEGLQYGIVALLQSPNFLYRVELGEPDPAREQTLADIEALVLGEQGDFRTLLTGTATNLDPKLAAIYDVPAPSLDGFAPATLPADGGRRGLLGHVSVLALAAHPSSTSPTRRGLFVREVLLCQQIPLPPAGLNTAIPEPASDAVTMRDRLQVHLEDPACASCHALTDYIGLGLENFVGLGGWRDTDGGEPIDAAGELDGTAFADAWALSMAVATHPDAAGFEQAGFRVEEVIADVVTGPAFRAAGEVR